MAAGSNGTVGDFVLRFIGDTASLDEAYAKVRQGSGVLDSTGQALSRTSAGWQQMGSTAAQAGRQSVAAATQSAGAQKLYNAAIFEATGRLIPLNEGLRRTDKTLLETAFDWRFAGQTASTAGDQAILAGGKFAAGAERSALATREAKAEVQLLSRGIGGLPREVGGFLAKLPGVAPALEAAFAATAVLFLVDAIIKGADAMSNWVAETFIYTEAMKAADKATAESNQRIVDNVAKLKELQKEYALIGETGPRKTFVEFKQLTEEVTKNEKALASAKEDVFLYNRGMFGTAASAEVAKGKILELTATLGVQHQQQANLQQQFIDETKGESLALAAARVAAAKAAGEARIELERQQGRARLNVAKDNSLEEGAIEARAAQQRYELELHSLELQLAIARSKGAEGVAEVKTIQGQIEALTIKHKATILQQYSDMMEKARAITSKPVALASVEDLRATINPITGELSKFGEVFDEVTTKADLLDRAGKALGVTFSAQLFAQLEQLRKGFNDLANSGMANATDLLQAQIVTLKATIAYMHSAGEETAFYDKQLTNLERQLARTTLRNQHFGSVAATVLKTLGVDARFMGGTMQNVVLGVAGAVAGMAQAWAQGGETIGQAAEKMVAAVLQALGQMAIAQVAVEIAKGFSDLADPLMAWHAWTHFLAAAKWLAVGAALEIAGGVIGSSASGSGGGSGQGGAGSDSAPFQTTGSAGQPAQQPVQQQNVITRFAAGGLVTGPTIAMIGDSMRSSSGAQREAAIPLDDPQAVSAIVQALGGGGGNMTFNINKGLISPDNLKKVAHQLSRKVKKGQLHLKASTTYRVNRRSQ